MKSFYIETYGCTSNKADSYIISNILTNSNHVQTTAENAEFLIFNTCGVKEQTENKIKARLRKVSNKIDDILYVVATTKETSNIFWKNLQSQINKSYEKLRKITKIKVKYYLLL